MSMNRSIFTVAKRGYTASSGRMFAAAEAATASSSSLVINFCTPYAPIMSDKVVDKVIIPGEDGEYGVTAGHSPMISQLKPGIVTVMHLNGESVKYFVSGGFSITHKDSSVTDISVPEAVALADLDENAIKTGFAESTRAASSAADGSVAKAVAQIEVTTYAAMARAIGLAL